MIGFKLGGLREKLDAIRNCIRWSEIDEVMLRDIIFGDIAFENRLSIRVLELVLTLVAWRLWGKNKWQERESRNSFAQGSCSKLRRFMLKSQSRETVLFSFGNLSKRLFR